MIGEPADERRATLGGIAAPAQPAAGGRARRRAGAAAAAREPGRDPETEIILVDPEVERGPDPELDPGVDVHREQLTPAVLTADLGRADNAHRADDGTRAQRRMALRRSGRRSRRPRILLIAATSGAMVVTGGLVVALAQPSGTPAPAALTQASTTSAPAPTEGGDRERPLRAPASTIESTGIPRRGDVDPASEKAVAYLDALRAAEVPISRSGLTETQAAAVTCEQLEAGADEDALVRALPAVLPTVTKAQAADVVAAARTHYC